MSRRSGGSTAWDNLERRVSELESGGGGGSQGSYDASTRLNASFIGGGNVSSTEFDYLDGVTGPIQSQLSTQAQTVINNNIAINDLITANQTDIATNLGNSVPSRSGTINGHVLTTDGTNMSWAEASGSYDTTTRLNASFIGGGNVSSTEFDYLDGVTSSIQTQLDAKVEVPVGIGYEPNKVVARNAANNAWTQVTKGYGVTELGSVGNVSGTGNAAINIASASRINNVDFIALNGAATSSNANKAIVTDGAGVLDWSDANLVPTRSGQTDGHVLTVDSGTTPNGMKWAAAGGGGSVHYFSAATVSAEQTFTTAVNAQVELQVQNHNASNLSSVWVQSQISGQTAAYNYVIPETGVWEIHYGITLLHTDKKLTSLLFRLFSSPNASTHHWLGTGMDYLDSRAHTEAPPTTNAPANALDDLQLLSESGTYIGPLAAGRHILLYCLAYQVGSTGTIRTHSTPTAFGGSTYLRLVKIA
jgi:hypothetical protein